MFITCSSNLILLINVILSSLADQMRMLNYPQWMDLLKQIFSNLLVHLKRAKVSNLIIHFTKVNKC